MKKIFFSWQTDKSDFKDYLYSCIRGAVAQLDDWEVVTITKRQQGAQDIANRIIEVLDSCDAVVSDVSIVGQFTYTDGKGRKRVRKVSNQNVLYETGYAMKRLGHERLLMFAADETTIETDHLPFDIRNRSVMIRDFTPANKSAITGEIKQILSDLDMPLEAQRPVIFCEHFSWQKTSETEHQSQFNMKNEEDNSYLLESVKYAGWEGATNKSLASGETRVIIPNAPIPPFDSEPGTIEFIVSRLGEKYRIIQAFNVTPRAAGGYDFGDVTPMPNSIVRL